VILPPGSLGRSACVCCPPCVALAIALGLAVVCFGAVFDLFDGPAGCETLRAGGQPDYRSQLKFNITLFGEMWSPLSRSLDRSPIDCITSSIAATDAAREVPAKGFDEPHSEPGSQDKTFPRLEGRSRTSGIGKTRREKPDHRDFARLLRPGFKGPAHHHASCQPDKLAPSHSSTSQHAADQELSPCKAIEDPHRANVNNIAKLRTHRLTNLARAVS
jgi:hypothetical protein